MGEIGITLSHEEDAVRRFECRRCNACCRQAGFVFLNAGEGDAVAVHVGMDRYAFAECYCDLTESRHLVLKKRPDESCIFLGPEGCTVYAARPRQCRDFPLRWRTARSFEYCEGLRRGADFNPAENCR